MFVLMATFSQETIPKLDTCCIPKDGMVMLVNILNIIGSMAAMNQFDTVLVNFWHSVSVQLVSIEADTRRVL
jgi:hypothetical protein